MVPQTSDDQPKRRRRWVLAACIVVIGLAGGVAWYLRPSRASQIDSLAVLPFTNVGGDANIDYLSDGITESLIDSLTHVPQLQVKSRHSAMEQGYRSAGWKGAVKKVIEARQARRKVGYSSGYGIAQLYTELGDKDQAFRWLNTAYREHDRHLLDLKTDFLLDPLRSDPRFADLVRKVGLPQ